VILSQAVLIILSFLAAFCSLIYELILAQILAATLGGSLLRYCTVVGLFSLSLGLGALAFGRKDYSSDERTRFLFHVEIILSALGLLSPLAIVFLDPFRNGSSVPFLWEVLFYVPVIAIGFFSGYELPMLLSFCRDRRKELQTLSSDYLGMFAGSLMVPFVIYPLGGPFLGSLWIGILNLGAAFLVFISMPQKVRKTKLRGGFYLLTSLCSISLLLLVGQNYWMNWIREWFVG
jgi:spermidine synthase